MAEIEAAQDPAEIEAEVSDLLFSVVDYARHIGADPVWALRRANGEFEKRFRMMESEMQRKGAPMEQQESGTPRS